MTQALDRVCHEVEEAIDQGYSIVVLSDRDIREDRVPISALAACGAVHHHLVRCAKRTRIGLVVESHEGRPTKIEGNTSHPASLGSTSSLAQAEMLNLYDPDRSKQVQHGEEAATWGQVVAAWTALADSTSTTASW